MAFLSSFDRGKLDRRPRSMTSLAVCDGKSYDEKHDEHGGTDSEHGLPAAHRQSLLAPPTPARQSREISHFRQGVCAHLNGIFDSGLDLCCGFFGGGSRHISKRDDRSALLGR
jgi:hypothetical protein